MILKPIYQPAGRAKEYGEYACNIYSGCNHRCQYCFASSILHKDRETFHTVVEQKRDIVESIKRQLDREHITGKLIHLCFTCDPYPAEIDTMPTREIIKAIKAAGNNVQILTKGGKRAERDFDLLDSEDWFGVTYTGGLDGVGCRTPNEPNAAPNSERFMSLSNAHRMGIRTWISMEPVLDVSGIFLSIAHDDFIDKFKIGKLNHHTLEDFGLPPIDWDAFGRECERLCKLHGRNYYLKEDLRAEMERGKTDESTD